MSQNQSTYIDFLKRKIPRAESMGFEPYSRPHPNVSAHAAAIAEWAVRGGRRAVFASFGLHKTRMNIQCGIWVSEFTDSKYLIIAPLGVRQEFTKVDGPALDVQMDFVRTTEEFVASNKKILITNYESVREGKIDIQWLATHGHLAGVGLDEASVLRSFGSKTYQEFLPLFKAVKYRFVFTATPSPNRYKELIHYAGFLGVMDTGEALTRFFQRDSTQANNLTLYPHMEAQFWYWLSTWSVFISRPSDLGFSDEGYDLPPLKIHWHKIEDNHRDAWQQTDSWGQHQLFKDQSQGLKESAQSKRNSIQLRVDAARTIIDAHPPERHWLIWHDLEAERYEIEKQMPWVKTVYGSQDLELREDLILGFSRGEYRGLGTKPIIAGSGCNFQRHCSDAIFLGVGYKANDFIQAIHRIHRFQQMMPVNIHILYLESESSIKDELMAKWRRHDELVATMTELLRRHGLNHSLKEAA